MKKPLIIAAAIAIVSISIASITCGKCSISTTLAPESIKEVFFNVAVGIFSASVFWIAFSWLPDKWRTDRVKALEARRLTMLRENLIDKLDGALIENKYEGMNCAIHTAGFRTTPNEKELQKIFARRTNLLGDIQNSIGWARQGGSGEYILMELERYFEDAQLLALQIDGSDDLVHTILETKRQIARFKKDNVFEDSLGKHLGDFVYAILFRPDVAFGESRWHL